MTHRYTAVVSAMLLLAAFLAPPPELLAQGGAKRKGALARIPYQAEGFTAVVLTGAGKVTVKQTGKESAAGIGPNALLQGVLVTVKDGTLFITGALVPRSSSR